MPYEKASEKLTIKIALRKFIFPRKNIISLKFTVNTLAKLKNSKLDMLTSSLKIMAMCLQSLTLLDTFYLLYLCYYSILSLLKPS